MLISETIGTGAAPAVTACAVDARGVATPCAILFCAVTFGRGIDAGGIDDDAAGDDNTGDEALAADDAAEVDTVDGAGNDESVEIAAAAVV